MLESLAASLPYYLLQKRKAKWEILKRGEKKDKKVFGIGNSDAHKTSHLGSAFTYVYTGDSINKLNEQAIYEALKKGHAVASNGPFVTFSTNKGGIPGMK